MAGEYGRVHTRAGMERRYQDDDDDDYRLSLRPKSEGAGHY